LNKGFETKTFKEGSMGMTCGGDAGVRRRGGDEGEWMNGSRVQPLHRRGEGCFSIYLLLPLFQIVSHSKNLRQLKHLKFDQNCRENYKESNDT